MTPLVLIAETSGKDRSTLAEVCEASGYRALVVESASLMLGTLKRRHADLVVVAADLPIGNSGEQPMFAALAALRSDPQLRLLPALVGLDRADAALAEQALQAGAEDVLYKPYRAQEVGQRLRNTVRRVFAERREQSHSEDQTWLSSLMRAGSVEQMRAVLDYETLRATRFGRTLACVVVRIRGGDPINAHASLALALKRRIRNVDHLFLGPNPNEFVLVLPETSAQQAIVLRGRIGEAFQDGAFTGISPVEHILEMGIAGIPASMPRDGHELFTIAQLRLAATA